MKFYLAYLIAFLLFFLSASQVQAADVYCSLNDGMKADGKTVLEHDGAKHEFCCSGCLDKFKADPNSFSQQVRQAAPTNNSEAEAACSSVCSG